MNGRQAAPCNRLERTFGIIALGILVAAGTANALVESARKGDSGSRSDRPARVEQAGPRGNDNRANRGAWVTDSVSRDAAVPAP